MPLVKYCIIFRSSTDEEYSEREVILQDVVDLYNVKADGKVAKKNAPSPPKTDLRKRSMETLKSMYLHYGVFFILQSAYMYVRTHARTFARMHARTCVCLCVVRGCVKGVRVHAVSTCVRVCCLCVCLVMYVSYVS